MKLVNKIKYIFAIVLFCHSLVSISQSYTQVSYDLCSSVTCGIYTANATSNPNLRLICTLSGSSATFRIEKCTGTFSSSGSFKIIAGGSGDSPCTGTTIKTANISSGITGYTFSSYTLTNTTNPLWFYGVYTNSANNNYYAGCIKITPIATPPAASTLTATSSPNSAILNGSVNPNGFATSVKFEYGLTSSLGNSTSSQSIGSGTTSQTVQATITGLSSVTNYYYRIVASNAGGTTYGSLVTFKTADPWVPPTVYTLGVSNITTNSVVVSGSVNPNGYNTSYLFKYGITTSMSNNTNAVNIGSGSSNQQVSANLTNLSESTTYFYTIYAGSTDGNGNIQYVQGLTNQFTTNTPTPFLLQLGSEMGFYDSSSSTTKLSNLEIGKTYYFKASIKNTGGTTFIGNFYLKKGLGTGYSNYISFISNSINSGSVINLSGTFIPSTAESNLSLGLYYSDGGSNQGQVSGGSFAQNITISTQSGIVQECDLSGLSTSSAYYEPTLFLCQRGVISGSAGGAANVTDFLKRAHLAKISFNGVYKLFSRAIPSIVPSDFYPTVYNDLLSQDPSNEYYYRGAKALLFLEYGDGISPFDRTKINFIPENFISRIDVLKVLLETFNIKPDLTNQVNPFPDDSDIVALLVNSPLKFGYIRKAVDLGIITSPSGGSNTTFRPFDNCLRGEAFIMLYRIMQKIESGSVADPNPSSSSYFEPLNLTLKTLALGLNFTQGNFNHYTKTSFSIEGVVPITFSHSYESFTADLPDDFYGVTNLGREKVLTYKPLGTGWSHEYHSFITMIENQMVIHWGNGTIHVYKSDGLLWKPESVGVYDQVSFEGTGTSAVIVVKTKSQIYYRFKRQSTNGPGIAQLYSIKDRNNNELKINYTTGVDGLMVISSVSDGTRQLNFSYLSGTNLLSQVSDPLGRTIHFGYTNNSTLNEYQLTSFTDAKGQTTQYIYGTANNLNKCKLLEKILLPKGNYIQNEYEANRRLNKTITGLNGIPANQTSVTVNSNYQDASKTLSSVVQVNRGTSTTNYNYSFNNSNLATTITGGNNLNISASYGLGSQPELTTSVISNSYNLDNIQYDLQGNVTQVRKKSLTNSETQTINMSYNGFNDILTYTDAKGNTTYFDYDIKGNLIGVRAPEGSSTSMTINSKGLPTESTDPEGIKTIMGYNLYGNINQISIPALGIASGMTYDAASRLISATDFKNMTTTYEYDNNNNLLKEKNPMNHITSYSYDSNDNLKSITNAKGGITSLTYDNTTDMITSASFGGSTKQFTYNPDGSLKTFTKPDGNQLTCTYDNLGRITSDGVNTYTYDNNFRIATITRNGKALAYGYDGFNRLISVNYSDFSGNTVQYTYDATNNLKSITYPDGKKVTYTYDALNRMKTLTDWNGKVITYNYRKDSKLNLVSYPNGMTVYYTYDTAGRVIGKATKRADNSTISSYTYTLDNAGNITQESVNEPYTDYKSPIESVSYTYNNANRIITAGTTNFTIDANGNTSKRGDISYTWDITDKITQSEGVNIEYDGLGLRRANGTKRYVLDITGNGNVLAETNNSGTPTAYYLHGQGLEARILPNGTTEYYVSDFRGSTIAMVDASLSANITHKYQYDEFGNILQLQESDFNPFRYVGKYGVMYENDHLVYMRARYYDPTIGRFLSEDPIWSINLYPYSNNNPISLIDFSGNAPIDVGTEVNNFLMQQEKNGVKVEDISNKSWAKFIANMIKKYSGYAIPVNSIFALITTKYRDFNSYDASNIVLAFTKDAANLLKVPGLSTAVEEASRGYGILYDYLEGLYFELRYNSTGTEIQLNEMRIKYYEQQMKNLTNKKKKSK